MNCNNKTLQISDFQILPPFSDNVRFEKFIVDLFNSVEKTTSFSRFGRSGQKQFGLDVKSLTKKTVIQCKLKLIDRSDKIIRCELIKELDKDFNAFLEYRKNNNLDYSRFIFASTFKNDTHIQTECDKKSTDEIEVDYWCWDKLLECISDELLLKYYYDFIRTITQYYNDKSDERKKLKEKLQNLPMIDKIHFLTNRFYPLKVLKQDSILNFYPFDENLNPKHSQYINRYTLKLTNDEIAESLKQWNHELLNNPSYKILDIFSFFSNNLILNISGIRVKEFSINPIVPQCSCLLCTFDNLDLKLLDERINSNNINYLKNESIQNQLENAYINYRTLNLSDAYNQIKQILDSVKNEKDEEKKKITEFICKSNLQNLYWFCTNTKFIGDSQRILEELTEPNLYNYLFDENIDEQVRTQLEYISNGKFIKSISYKIDKSLIEIRKHVDANRNVQFHIDELIYHLGYIYSFIKKNYLFYDLFDDFKVLVEKSIDGIFASFSVQKNIPKIRRFDLMLGSYMEIKINDFIINLCIFHCDTKNLIRAFKRYDIKKLPVNPKKIINTAINLCKSPELFDKYSRGNEYRSIFRNFESVFENLLFLISACEDSPKINDLFSIAINLLDHSKSRFTLLGFRHFLAEKKKFINYENLITLLRIVITDYKHEEKLFKDIIWIHKKEYPKEKITDSSFIDIVIESKSKNSLFYIWFIVSSKIKDEIQEIIINSLQENFNFTHYIDCSIYKIIPHEQLLANAYEYLQKAKNKGLYEKVGKSYITDDYNDFNYLIQLVYSFEIKVPKQFVESFEQHSDYHKFLLSPDEFDYSNFDIEWLFVFQHKSYWERFKKIEKLKMAVREKLNKNFSNELAEVYHKYLN